MPAGSPTGPIPVPPEEGAAAERLLRAVVNWAPAGMLVVDQHGTIVLVNREAELLFGYQRDELIGASIELLVPPRSQNPHARMRAAFGAHSEHRSMVGRELAAVRKDGTEIPVEVGLTTIQPNGHRFVIASVTDISERKRAERDLHESSKRYHDTLDNMLEGCQIVAPDGRYVYVNDAAARHGRMPKDRLLGHAMQEVYPGIEKTALFAEIQRCAREQVPVQMINAFSYPDGGTGVFELRMQPVPEGVFILSMDVTEREEAQAALRVSEARYRGLIEGSIQGILIHVHGTVRLANPALVKLLGYERPEDFVGAEIWPFIAPEDRDVVRTYFRARARGADAPSRYEFRVVRKGGAVIWLDCVVSTIVWDGEAATLATMVDVSDRKEAEHALVASDERFRQLAENISEVFFMVDAAYRKTLYINPAYEAVWGRSCESLYEDPRSFLEPLLPDDRARVIANTAHVQQGEHPGPIEFRVLHSNGDVRWVMANAIPIRNERGEVYRIMGTALDITERRAVQAALEDSEARYRKLTEASYDGICLVADGVIHEANAGLARILGYTLDEVIGRPVVEFVSEESRAEVLRHFAQGLEGRYELVAKRKDGSKIYMEATGKNHVVAGRPGRIAALRDITAQRSLEEQFRQAQKMEAVGRLAGGVAHDFNNLLTVIGSYSEILFAELESSSPLRADVAEIRRAAASAATLTRQLLAFSRQQVLQPRVLNLNEIVAGAEKMLQRLIGEDVDLVTVLAADAGNVRADPGQIEQVIMNLAVNARDAMPDGGRLTLETGNVDFTETYRQKHLPARPGPFVMLAVTDTGTGMDEETRNHIFEPFFTTKEVGKGTGLGLATVYGIVKQSDGFIWVYSEPGEGTTFKIYLPRTLAESEDRRGPPGEPRRGTETVLLVEDAAAVRSAARRMLERYGYTVLEAPDGATAQAIVKEYQGPIHLLLTDVVMPEMGGGELAERLREHRPEMKVIFMSGYTRDAVMRRGVLENHAGFLQKPFSPDAVARTVREVLDQSQD